MQPFDLDHVPASLWSDELKPIGQGTWQKETFEDWWLRNQLLLSHLPADLCEQWIYRHWDHTSFDFLPLDTLRCSRETWAGDQLLKSIYRWSEDELHPQFDYDTFQRKGGADRHATALALDNGTWDYPMILLSTPSGVINLKVSRPSVRFVVVEGHQRHRYLNALHQLGRPPLGPHEVLIVSSPLVELQSHP